MWNTLLGNSASPVILCHVGGIGDHYLALPAMRALTALLGPDIRLAGHPEAIRLVYGELGVRGEPIDFTIKGGDLTRDLCAIAEEIGDCEMLVSLLPFSNLMADQVERAVKPGFALGFGVTSGINVPLNEKQHAFDMYLDVPLALDANCLGGEVVRAPQLPASSIAFAREVRASIPPRMKLLVVHADTKPEKVWDPHRFADLVHGFVSQHTEAFVLVVGSVDLGLADGPFEQQVVSCVNVPFLDSIALVSQADAFVGVDSCMLHVADLFRVPSIGLFGGTDSRHWGLRFARGEIVEGHGAMENIGVAPVRTALERHWTATIAGNPLPHHFANG